MELDLHVSKQGVHNKKHRKEGKCKSCLVCARTISLIFQELAHGLIQLRSIFGIGKIAGTMETVDVLNGFFFPFSHH